MGEQTPLHNIIAAITSSQMGKLAKVYSEKNLLKAAFVLYPLALVIILFVPNLWLLLIPTLIFGFAQGIDVPSRQTLLIGLAPMKHRAAFMSVNQMTLRLGQTLGPLLMGAFFVVWGIGGVFYAGAAFSIATFTLLVIMIR